MATRRALVYVPGQGISQFLDTDTLVGAGGSSSIAALTLGNQKIAVADTYDVAFGKLQGQANLIGGASWKPAGNSATVPVVQDFPAFTAVGTATARNVATTNELTRTKRIGFVSAATAAAICGGYQTAAQFTTGSGTAGGFMMSRYFGVSDAATVAGARMFVGVSSSVAAPTNVEPNTLLNSFGIAQLSTDSTQLYLINSGSAAQQLALGTNFPPASNSTLYRLSLHAPTGLNGVINWRVDRMGTAFTTGGTVTPATAGVQTPLSTTLLALRAWRCNNATALACALDFGRTDLSAGGDL